MKNTKFFQLPIKSALLLFALSGTCQLPGQSICNKIINPFPCGGEAVLPDACHNAFYLTKFTFQGATASGWKVINNASSPDIGLSFNDPAQPVLSGNILNGVQGLKNIKVRATIDGNVCNRIFQINVNQSCNYNISAPIPCSWDIAFVLDYSKSMDSLTGIVGNKTKWGKLLEFFIDDQYVTQMEKIAGLSSDDRWGFFFFGNNNVIHDTSFHKGVFGDLIDVSKWPPAPVGNSPMGGGLQSTLQLFFHPITGPNATYRGQAVILMTDGIQNRNPKLDVIPLTNDFAIRRDSIWEPGAAILSSGRSIVSGTLGDTLPISKEVFVRNNIKIYTIGIGSGMNSATGSDLDRMSDEFVNSEDQTQLLSFFNMVIPKIFKGHSPRIVDVFTDTMPGPISNRSRTFDLNDGLKNLVIQLVAIDKPFSGVLPVLKQNGVPVTPEIVLANDKVVLFKVNFPMATASGPDITSKGNWTLTYSNSTDTVLCTTTLFTDDEYLKYEIDFGAKKGFFTGDPLPVGIKVQYNGVQVTDAAVEAFVVRPQEDLGNSVANTAVDLNLLQNTLDLSMGQAKYAYLEEQTDFHTHSQLELYDSLPLQITPDGYYTGTYTNTNVVGTYRVIVRIKGTNPTGGDYEGWDMKGIYVDFAHPEDIDPNPEITPADDNPGPAGDTPGGAPAAGADRTTPTALRMVASPEKADTSGVPNPKLDPKIDPPKSSGDTAKGAANTDVLLPKTLKGNQTFRLKITPTNRFGNKLGPAQEDRIFVRLSKGKVGPVHDNLDGSYTATLLVPARTNPTVQIGVIDPRHPIVEKCLYCFRSRFGLSAHPGVTIPLARLDSLYGPSVYTELNLSYEFNPWLALEAVGGMYVFNPSFGILGASLFGVIKKTDFPSPGWDIRAAAGAGVFGRSGEAATIGYGIRASLTRRYNLHCETGLQLGYFNLPKPKYAFATVGLVWHYFF